MPPELLYQEVERRACGTPLEYVLGWADFYGQRISLVEGVFIPRRRTEFLVSLAMDLLDAGGVLLDLCCGSGALARVIAKGFVSDTPLTVWASDIDPLAVECARRNLTPVGGQVVEGDLYKALPATLRGRLNVIVANAPYVPSLETELLPREARLHEPRQTFDGGRDGFVVQRRVAQEASSWLAPGGSLLLETSEANACGTRLILEDCGLAARIMRSEDWDATVVIGTVVHCEQAR